MKSLAMSSDPKNYFGFLFDEIFEQTFSSRSGRSHLR